MKRITGLICLLLCVLVSSTAFAACEREEDHRYGSWKTKTNATCTRQGHQFRYCQKCDHWEQRYTAKLPHTPGEMTVTKEPTCTEKGKQEAICQECGNLVRYNMDKLEHAYGEMTVLSEATCKNAGKGQHVCADCGAKKTVKLDKLEHTYGKMTVLTEATCRSAGKGQHVCAGCGAKKTVKLDKLEHAFGEWTVTREPAGKRKGMRSAVCTLCGGEREEYFFWEGTLYEGMEPCDEVIGLQEKLRDLGYYKGAIRSGQFGDLTTSAVEKFQRDNDLDDTGVADSEMLNCLNSAWEQATGKRAAPALDAQEMENAQDAQMIAE